jgi:hypothetical protein
VSACRLLTCRDGGKQYDELKAKKESIEKDLEEKKAEDQKKRKADEKVKSKVRLATHTPPSVPLLCAAPWRLLPALSI